MTHLKFSFTKTFENSNQISIAFGITFAKEINKSTELKNENTTIANKSTSFENIESDDSNRAGNGKT